MFTKSSAMFFALTGAPLTPVDWNGPGELMAVLDIENGQLTMPDPGHDWHCAAHVMRPPVAEPAQYHPENKFECSGHVTQEGQDRDDPASAVEKRIVIYFGEKSPVAAWGSSFDKDPHFTVQGRIAKRLFFNLARIHSTGGYGELIERIEQCAPTGSADADYGKAGPDCSVLYVVSRRGHVNAPEPAKLICSARINGPDISGFECTFLMYPDPESSQPEESRDP